jgi:hypothetical protein
MSRAVPDRMTFHDKGLTGQRPSCFKRDLLEALPAAETVDHLAFLVGRHSRLGYGTTTGCTAVDVSHCPLHKASEQIHFALKYSNIHTCLTISSSSQNETTGGLGSGHTPACASRHRTFGRPGCGLRWLGSGLLGCQAESHQRFSEISCPVSGTGL